MNENIVYFTFVDTISIWLIPEIEEAIITLAHIMFTLCGAISRSSMNAFSIPTNSQRTNYKNAPIVNKNISQNMCMLQIIFILILNICFTLGLASLYQTYASHQAHPYITYASYYACPPMKHMIHVGFAVIASKHKRIIRLAFLSNICFIVGSSLYHEC